MRVSQAVIDAMTDPAAIVDVSTMCVVCSNSAFACLVQGGRCEAGADLLRLFPISGPMLAELCRETVSSDGPIDTCFSFQPPHAAEPCLWTARLNCLDGGCAESLVALSIHEETDHIRLIRKLDRVVSDLPSEPPAHDLAASLSGLMERTVSALDATYAAVMLLADDGLVLQRVACSGSPAPQSPRIDLASSPTAAEAIKLGRTLYVGRHAASRSERTLMEQAGCGGILICPIKLSAGSGVVATHFSTASSEPSQDRVCILEIIANKCAALIENRKNESTLAILYDAERRAHALAHQGARHITALLNSLSDGIIIIDSSGAVRFANDSLARLFGVDLQNLSTWSQLRDSSALEPSHWLRDKRSTFDAGEVLKSVSPGGYDLVLNVSSTMRNVKVTGGAVYDGSGVLESLILVFHDWTILQRMRQAQHDVLRFVSHDLRTPLTQILARAQLIDLTAEKPESVRKGAGSIVKAAKRMNEMIQDMTDSARLEMGSIAVHLKTIDIIGALGDIVDSLSTANPATPIHLRESGRVPPVSTDPLRVDRIVSNLVSNAAKYSPPGSPVMINVEAADDSVMVSVSDRGAGMSEEQMALVFDRYYRSPDAARSTEGLGLGLYISKSFVEALGGRIWVESAIGKGSTFRFTIPLAPNTGE